MTEVSSSKKLDNLFSNENLTIYLYVAIALSLLLIIINVFAGADSENTQNIGSQIENSLSENQSNTQNNLSNTDNQKIEMQPVNEFATVVYSCQSYVENNDIESYCNSFSKVDFDGLQVFVNCEYSGLQSSLTSKLSCEDHNPTISEVCDKNNLNDEEFVSVNGKVNTCYESKLG